MSIDYKPPVSQEEVGIVCVSTGSVTVLGTDSSGNAHQKTFNPDLLEGRDAGVVVAERALAESWTKYKGALLRLVPAHLLRQLHSKAKAIQHKSGKDALKAVWVEVMKEPWPGEAELRNSAEERLRLMKQLAEKFYPVDPAWPLETLRRYAERPELIAGDKAAAVAASAQEATLRVTERATVDPDAAVEAFLKEQE